MVGPSFADVAPPPNRRFVAGPPSGTWLDVLLGMVCAAVAGVVAWHLFELYKPLQIGSEQWFQADLGRVWAVLTDRYSGYHERSRIHPLFSLVATPAVYGLRRIVGFDTLAAVRVWTAACAALWAVGFFSVARGLGFARFDAALTTILVIVSGAALVWLPVPETYALGSLTILACVGAASWNQRQPLPDWILVAAAAMSLAVTVTNFMIGLALLWRARPPRRATQLAVNAFFVIACCQVAQHFVFPTARGMLDLRSEARFVFDASSAGPVARARALTVHGMVIPALQTPIEFDTKTPMLSVQQSPVGSSGTSGSIATALWLVLLGSGVAWLWRHRPLSDGYFVVVIGAVGQALLHMVYGDQTFLYSLHYVPLFVLIATAPLRSHVWVTRLLALSLVVLCLLNNGRQTRLIATTLDRISVVAR